ncbi:MAG: hypothetical protein GJ676_19420 [Rhodobacteraceae bacterium]|nr:hypothetical protein [Paracoccaceae bacterium]
MQIHSFLPDSTNRMSASDAEAAKGVSAANQAFADVFQSQVLGAIPVQSDEDPDANSPSDEITASNDLEKDALGEPIDVEPVADEFTEVLTGTLSGTEQTHRSTPQPSTFASTIAPDPRMSSDFVSEGKVDPGVGKKPETEAAKSYEADEMLPVDVPAKRDQIATLGRLAFDFSLRAGAVDRVLPPTAVPMTAGAVDSVVAIGPAAGALHPTRNGPVQSLLPIQQPEQWAEKPQAMRLQFETTQQAASPSETLHANGVSDLQNSTLKGHPVTGIEAGGMGAIGATRSAASVTPVKPEASATYRSPDPDTISGILAREPVDLAAKASGPKDADGKIRFVQVEQTRSGPGMPSDQVVPKEKPDGVQKGIAHTEFDAVSPSPARSDIATSQVRLSGLVPEKVGQGQAGNSQSAMNAVQGKHVALEAETTAKGFVLSVKNQTDIPTRDVLNQGLASPAELPTKENKTATGRESTSHGAQPNHGFRAEASLGGAGLQTSPSLQQSAQPGLQAPAEGEQPTPVNVSAIHIGQTKQLADPVLLTAKTNTHGLEQAVVTFSGSHPNPLRQNFTSLTKVPTSNVAERAVEQEFVRSDSAISGPPVATVAPDGKVTPIPNVLNTATVAEPRMAIDADLFRLVASDVADSDGLETVARLGLEANSNLSDFRAVQSTPFPVGQRPETIRSIAIQLGEQLARNQNGPIEVALSPEELGRVRMVLSVSEAGVSVSIVAERQETLELMRRNVDQLSADLKDLGYSTLGFDFSNGEGARSDGERTDDTGSGSNSDELVRSSEVPTATPDNPAMPSAGLDMRM